MPLIPVGVTDFKELRSGHFYFVDKSMFIADVMRSGAKVTLLPRPRRFGKTMNLSMLHRFLDLREDNHALFNGLAVAQHEDVMAQLGAWPTIFISFKDIKYTNFQDCQDALAQLMARLFKEHKADIMRAEPEDLEEVIVESILRGEARPAHLQSALATLTELLHRATGKKAVVLIDEYDMPIHSGYHSGYYQDIVAFMRNLLSGAFKDNPHLHKGVLTGILRLAKESIFSGFNNPDVHTLLGEPFSHHFGFTEVEVSHVLADVGISEREAEVRRWYNGYRFGPHTMYNPWSIMKMAANPQQPLQPHWVNTSDNILIRKLITDRNAMSQTDLEVLINRDHLRRELNTNIVLDDFDAIALWSMLVFSGYLKTEQVQRVEGRLMANLAIPNLEVAIFFEQTVRKWLGKQMGPSGLEPLLSALLADEMDAFEAIFAELVKQVLSFHDTSGKEPEKVYHTFMLGMLVNLRGTHDVTSNREAGFGRYDVSLLPKDPAKTAYLFEFKVAGDDPEKAAQSAIKQIISKDYAAAARRRGIGQIRALGVAVDGKSTHIETRML